MADNGIGGPVIGVSCDGIGYGTDGAIWGCEILVGDEADFARAGHLDYFPLLGGDSAAQDTWRPAAGLLHAAYGAEWRTEADFCLRRIESEAVRLADARLKGGARLPATSSLGRLFDAVAFLLGVCDRNRYEAEAAMTLEALARRHSSTRPLAFDIRGLATSAWPGEPLRLDVRPMVRELVARTRAGENSGPLARVFHDSVSAMLIEAARRVAERTGLDRVVLSGGCFANRLVLEAVSNGLASAGLAVFAHEHVPTGDGGIALGQAVVAAERRRRNR
jgi:hydrogenase maturation protein HypF